MSDKKPHDIIYLQWNDEDISEDEGVTWCQDSINNSDVMYIRHDLHLVENEKLREALEVFMLPRFNCASFNRCNEKEWSCMNLKEENCRFIKTAKLLKETES